MANSSKIDDIDFYVPTPAEIEKYTMRARKMRAEYIASLFSRPAAAEKDAPVSGAATA